MVLMTSKSCSSRKMLARKQKHNPVGCYNNWWLCMADGGSLY
uniref:Uncharacterized protein n=1 Tax=Setaria italica TaxID=4555 RepID=K3YF55_SETIT